MVGKGEPEADGQDDEHGDNSPDECRGIAAGAGGALEGYGRRECVGNGVFAARNGVADGMLAARDAVGDGVLATRDGFGDGVFYVVDGVADVFDGLVGINIVKTTAGAIGLSGYEKV